MRASGLSDYLNKKHLALVAFAMATSMLVFVGVCIWIVFCHERDSSRELQGQAKLLSGDLTYRYDVVYPTGYGDRIDTLIRGYAKKHVDDFLTKTKGEKIGQSIYSGTYKIIHHGLRTITIIFTWQQAGNPNLTSQNIITFDLQQKRLLTISDILTSDAQNKVGIILYNYFKSIHTALSPKQILELVQFKGVKDFSLESDTITMYIRGEGGIKTVAIKKELLGDILNTTYVAPDLEIGNVDHRHVDFGIDSMPKCIDPTQKMLALTFDDGPGIYTAGLLDALKQYQSHATFFVVGRQVPAYSLVERRVVVEGNEIGNHSWNHAHLPLLTAGQLEQEIMSTQQGVAAATGGYIPSLMRPPYGEVNGFVNTILSTHGLREALWNVDTEDWLYRDAQLVYDRIMSSAGDGKVILLHDIHPTSVEAAIRAIPQLVAQGYQLVTMSELQQYRN